MFKTLKELDRTEGTFQLVNGKIASQLTRGYDLKRPSSLTNSQKAKPSPISREPTFSNPPIVKPRQRPLRWPQWKKHVAFSSVCLFTFFKYFSGAVLSESIFRSRSSSVSVYTLSLGLLTWVVFILGISNFILVSTAAYIGKRPVFVIPSGITTIAAIKVRVVDLRCV